MSWRLPLGGVLDRARDASERAFVLGMQTRGIEASQAETEQLIRGLETIQKSQDEQIADVVKAVDSMNEMLQLQVDATADLNKMVRDESDESQKLYEDNTNQINKFYELLVTTAQRIDEAVASIKAQLAGWTARANGSAGGLIGYGVQKDELLPKGWPIATGTILWHANNPATGWLRCYGQAEPKATYPELAYVFGDMWGTATNANYFQMPTKAQLTAATELLNNDRIHPYART